MNALKFINNFHPYTDGSDCIENKLCLISWKDSWKNRGNGRGGLDSDIFIYALLDWEAKARQRQTRFEVAGGVGRATIRTMKNYFEDNGNYPSEVTNARDREWFLTGKKN